MKESHGFSNVPNGVVQCIQYGAYIVKVAIHLLFNRKTQFECFVLH